MDTTGKSIFQIIATKYPDSKPGSITPAEFFETFGFLLEWILAQCNSGSVDDSAKALQFEILTPLNLSNDTQRLVFEAISIDRQCGQIEGFLSGLDLHSYLNCLPYTYGRPCLQIVIIEGIINLKITLSRMYIG